MARGRRRGNDGEAGPAPQRRRPAPSSDSESSEVIVAVPLPHVDALPETIETNPTPHVEAFVEYCNRHLIDEDGDDGNVDVARAKLLRLLCRKPAQNDDNINRFYTGFPDGCELEPEKHISPEHGDDEGSKMARIGNAIRHHYQKGALEERTREQIREIPGWSTDDAVWNPEFWNCRCETCASFSVHDLKVYKFRYLEVLERRFPWYFPDNAVDDQVRSEHGIRNHSYEILKESELRNFAREHWKTFFGRLQELMSTIAMDVTPSRELTMKELHALANDNGGNVMELFKSGDVVPTQRTYATIALLNDYRRNFRHGREITGDVDDDLQKLDDPRFRKEYAHNCEGTIDDHYCLGDRKFGQKRYIGVTDNLQQRHTQHAEGEGAYFIAVLTGLKKCFCRRRMDAADSAVDSCGGWKLTSNPQLARRGENQARYVFPGRCTELEENVETVKIIKEFGMLNTRGGEYVIPEAASECQSNISEAMKVFASVGKNCTLCFERGHHRSKCPRVVRGAHDDENLHNMWNLRCSDSDERGNHYKVSKAITRALVNNFSVGRIVTLSELSEQNERNQVDGVEPTMRRVIESLYGPDFALRPLQQAALRRISSREERPDITLTLPTAYGKTLVYLSAAVYEIILARREQKPGKVVVFLPYSALMSDVAENLAKMTKSTQNEVAKSTQNEVARFMYGSIVFDGDARVRGMSMPYAGVFHVNDVSDTSERIRWTIWRGRTSDSNMSALEREDIFQNADIVFTTPDKWAWPVSTEVKKRNEGSDPSKCDSFIKMFGDKFIGSLRLCVVDEAHEFRDLLGGNMCELLKRMRCLKDMCNESAVPMRTILISATMPDPRRFTKELTGKIVNGDDLHIVPESQPGNAYQSQVFPLEPIRDPDSDDVTEAFDKVESFRGARHKILCILKEELECEFMCKELLKPCNFRGARRVLIFVDSKTVATRIIRSMKTNEFKQAWNREELAPVVTPYHGDVAPYYRKLCEKKMAQFVSKPREGESQQIHFIIATSALEAGVNIKGLDVVIIPSILRCTMRSVKQRLGRGGREADFPTVCIVGSSEASQDVSVDTEPGDEDVGHESDQNETGSDLDSEDLDEPPMNANNAPHNFVREPLRFLTSGLTPFGICSTRAMKIHGAMQFIGNLHCLDRSLSERSHARLNELLVGIPLDDQQPLRSSDAYSMLQRLLRDEMPATERSGKVMTMRGISDHTISVHEAYSDIKPIYHNTRGIRIRGAHIYKDLGRISSTLMMKQLHWNAQFFTPHGSLVRVVDYKMRSQTARDGDISRWMENISAVYVKRLKRGDSGYPYITRGESHEHVWLEQDDVSGSVQAQVRRGSLRVRSTWLGFYYYSPYRNCRIETDTQEPHRWRDWHVDLAVAPLDLRPEEQDKRMRTWEFFHPAESSKNAWQWDITTEFPFAGSEHDNSRSSILRLLCAELRLRVSESLKCSPRLFAISISSQALLEKIKSAESDIQSRNLSREHLKLQDAQSWRACALAKLSFYEEGMVGIAMEGLRTLFPVENNDVSLFSQREQNTLLLDDDTKLHELWDFAVKDEWENFSAQLRDSVVTSLNWLNEASNAVEVRARADWK